MARPSRPVLVAALAACVIACEPLAPAHGDGEIDVTFGKDGLAAETGGRQMDRVELTEAEAYQPGGPNAGKILVAGTACCRGHRGGDALLARFNADGSRDLDFGVRGRVIYSDDRDDPNPQGIPTTETVSAVGIRPSGQILVLVSTRSIATYPDQGLVQLVAIDQDGAGPRVLWGISGRGFAGNDLALIKAGERAGEVHLTHGRLVPSQPSIPASRPRLIRLSAKHVEIGHVDFPGLPEPDFAPGPLVATSDGGDLAAGSVGRDGANVGAGVMRIGPQGEVDQGFGDNGTAMALSGPRSTMFDLVGEDSGAVTALGGRRDEDGFYSQSVARFGTDGSPEAWFGLDGFSEPVQMPAPAFEPFYAAMAQDSQGRLLLSGETGSDPSETRLLATRLNPDGATDYSFGDGSGTLVIEACGRGPDSSSAVLPGRKPGDAVLVGTSARPARKESIGVLVGTTNDSALPPPDVSARACENWPGQAALRAVRR